MKATEELTHTHDVVRKALEIFTLGNPRFQESIKTLRRAVEAHGWLQDEIFIPALKGQPLIQINFLAELAQEHKDLDQMIGQLLKTYPLAEQVLDAATLNKLRDEMERRKFEVREAVKA